MLPNPLNKGNADSENEIAGNEVAFPWSSHDWALNTLQQKVDSNNGEHLKVNNIRFRPAVSQKICNPCIYIYIFSHYFSYMLCSILNLNILWLWIKNKIGFQLNPNLRSFIFV